MWGLRKSGKCIKLVTIDKKGDTMKNDTVAEYASQEALFHALPLMGYKVLLRNYECPLGELTFVAKKGGYLVFIGLDNQKRLKPVAEYYIKRYGIKDIPYRIVGL